MTEKDVFQAVISDLEHCGNTLIGISRKLAAALDSTNETAGVQRSQQEEKTVVEPVPENKPLAFEDVRAVLAEKSRSGHTAEIRVLLEKFGAEKLSDIDPSFYEALLAEAGKIA